MKNWLSSNCFYNVFSHVAPRTHDRVLDTIDFRSIVRGRLNMLGAIVSENADQSISLETRKEFERVVLLPILHYVVKHHQTSCLNHFSEDGRHPKAKTVNALLLFNYFEAFRAALKVHNVVVGDIAQLWLFRKLVRYPSKEKEITSLIHLLSTKIGKIKNPGCIGFVDRLLFIGKNSKKIMDEFLEKNAHKIQLFTKEKKRRALNHYIERTYLRCDSLYMDFYEACYNEPFSYLTQCRKHASLFQSLTFTKLKTGKTT